jgi:PAS domain S-box-containing protein
MNWPFESGFGRRVIEWIDREESNLFWAASAMVLVIAGLDGLVFRELSLGAWYIVPLIIFSCVLEKPWLVGLSLLFSLFREMLSNPVDVNVSIARFAAEGVLFTAASLFMSDLINSRRMGLRLISDLQKEVALRHGAEAELHLLVEMAPLSILTADDRGVIVRANAMAGTLFGARAGELTGMNVSQVLPMLARIPEGATTNLSAQCSAFRMDGQAFLANVWFRRMEGRVERTVVLISDESDNVRLRRDEALELGVSGSRALLSAVAVHANQALETVAELHATPDNTQDLLAQLRKTLRQLLELTPPSMVSDDTSAGPVNPTKLLQEFHVFCGPMFEDLPVQVRFQIPEQLPLVSSNYSALIQLLLVLVRMSHRRLRQAARGELLIEANAQQDTLRIRVWDSAIVEDREETANVTLAHPDGMALLTARASLSASGGELSMTAAGYIISVPLIAPRHAGWTAASGANDNN